MGFDAARQRRLPTMLFDDLAGGAEDERTIAENVAAFSKIKLLPHRLRDVRTRTTDVDLLGTRIAAPLVVGPTCLNGAIWPNGDTALATAAKRAGVPFGLSTASNERLETVAKVGGELWFQLYVVHRQLAASLVDRAANAGYAALILTVDVPVNGKRKRDLRNGFQIPLRYSARTILDALTHPRWTASILMNGTPTLANLAADNATTLQAQNALLRRERDASFDLDDLACLRDLWPRRLLVKGVCRPEDIARCFAIGTDAVVISNHGGRQLDDSVSPMEILPQVRHLGPVLVDGGVRRGSDIVKAIALGAQAVLLGRSVLYGLAASGEAAAAKALAILCEEIDRTLALIGCPAASRQDESFIAASALSPVTGQSRSDQNDGYQVDQSPTPIDSVSDSERFRNGRSPLSGSTLTRAFDLGRRAISRINDPLPCVTLGPCRTRGFPLWSRARAPVRADRP
ncbi:MULTISPECIES: alpha-hydroxy-acid oxidizing protein [unclassified Bradyrhizobium]|uniref:alpha-hydroxy-acid oxidizing protein n=1 Tax=unclassified Bradyrhizobium TaxID=2631580 RepID=UPI0029166D34|nr:MULTISPECIES: alpha-hydroxy-acid oxidizing protein [unclassified Bradyrhizobium]